MLSKFFINNRVANFDLSNECSTIVTYPVGFGTQKLAKKQMRGYRVRLILPSMELHVKSAQTSKDLYDFLHSVMPDVHVQLNTATTAHREVEVFYNFAIYLDGKILSQRPIPLSCYNMNGYRTTMSVKFFGLLGGSSTYSIIQECEAQLFDSIEESSVCCLQEHNITLGLLHKSLSDFAEYDVQSFSTLKYIFGPERERIKQDKMQKWIQDVGLFCIGLYQAKSRSQYILAISNFIAARSQDKPIWRNDFSANVMDFCLKVLNLGAAVTTDYNFMKWSAQSRVETGFEHLGEMLGYWEKIKSSPLFGKLYKIFLYIISSEIFQSLGLTFNDKIMKSFERDARKMCLGKMDFIESFLNLIHFIYTRGVQSIKLGSLQPFYLNGDSYVEWYEQCIDLTNKYEFLSNPIPHGFTIFQWHENTKSCIEKGEAIVKYTTNAKDRLFLSKNLNELKRKFAEYTTKTEALKGRAAPFSIMLSGGTALGKSTVQDLLYNHYARIFDLPTDGNYKYTRMAGAEYWDNFSTSQWCLIMDDVAAFRPDTLGDIDPSVAEILQVINNVAYIPNQAALEDKGRTPFKGELVIGSTNTFNLSAHMYYNNSAAVLRRFPYFVELKVKQEYQQEDLVNGGNGMLDGSKVKGSYDPESEYPDLWEFHVYKYVPVERTEADFLQGLPLTAKAEKVSINGKEMIDDINEFLAWFIAEAKKHKLNQERVDASVSAFQNVPICKKCYMIIKKCDCEYNQHTFDEANVQSDEDQNMCASSFINFFRINLLGSALLNFIDGGVLHMICRYFFSFAVVRRLYWRYIQELQLSEIIFDEAVEYVRSIGDSVEAYLGMGNTRILKEAISYIAWTMKWYVGIKSFFYVKTKVSDLLFGEPEYTLNPEDGSASVTLTRTEYQNLLKLSKNGDMNTIQHIISEKQEAQYPLAPQGQQLSTGKAPKPREAERLNVWVNTNFQLTPTDLTDYSQSWNSMSRDTIIQCLSRSCVSVVYEKSSGGKTYNRAVCVANHVYLTNAHALPKEYPIRVNVIQDKVACGITRNITVSLYESDVYIVEGTDIAFLNIKYIPIKKDISELFVKDCTTLSGKGTYVSRDEFGIVEHRSFHNVQYRPNESTPIGSQNLYAARVNQNTKEGFCGSLAFVETGYGPVICGIHVLGHEVYNAVGILAVNRRQVLDGIQHFGRILDVQTMHHDLPHYERPLGDLHFKSTSRFFFEGCANVYGTIKGFRTKPKTCVAPTLISEAVQKRGYQCKFTAPPMGDWRALRIAQKELIKPNTTLNTNIIHREAINMSKTIIEKLIAKDELRELHVYDTHTSINGAPGVQYVDGMKRSTSMGAPYNKSKSHFVVPLNDGTDDITFTPEIMERINEIETSYLKGQTVMPPYKNHLKDEPIKFAKAAIGKVRNFTGCHGPWAVVVRKYLLPFVRVLQRNRFIFEAAPGTNATSLEWQEIYMYLTQHGKDRMVAGDYAAFDKSMSSMVILEAFNIIKNVCAAAGYTEEQLRVIDCIAEDTAFPLVDFDGDLIQFYGSNPSGHPLTVIINSLVNSLYMRYCYAILSPDGNASKFQDHVSLMTYGDDNIMGVSKEAEFFNHTAIMNVLASNNITYTMADKESASVPYINISECSFLKREWVWDEDVGAMMAPLDHSSIEKMLTIGVQSKAINEYQHAIAVIQSALNEYFYYGKDTYNAKLQMFKEIVQEVPDLHHYVMDNTFQTWEDLKERFWRSSEHVSEHVKTYRPF